VLSCYTRNSNLEPRVRDQNPVFIFRLYIPSFACDKIEAFKCVDLPGQRRVYALTLSLMSLVLAIVIIIFTIIGENGTPVPLDVPIALVRPADARIVADHSFDTRHCLQQFILSSYTVYCLFPDFDDQ
jgi:hypothetical protein